MTPVRRTRHVESRRQLDARRMHEAVNMTAGATNFPTSKSIGRHVWQRPATGLLGVTGVSLPMVVASMLEPAIKCDKRRRSFLRRARFSRCPACPAFVGMVKGADVLVAEQPCNLGYRQIFFLQIALGEVKSQLTQDAAEGEPF